MKRTGPDSVNSWLVALACFFLSMVIYAIVRLSGVLFVASMARFNVDRQSASMPYILTDVIQSISSPLTGYLAHKFGVRLVMSFGCLVSAIGIGTCFLAENMTTVTVLWGVVVGVGFGLSSPLLAVMVTQYFVNKRAMAIGFVYFGGYVGYSILPGVAEHLIDYYGLSGTFLYLSGFMLNCIPAAMLLLKPNFSTEPPNQNNFTPKLSAPKVVDHQIFDTGIQGQFKTIEDSKINGRIIANKDILKLEVDSSIKTLRNIEKTLDVNLFNKQNLTGQKNECFINEDCSKSSQTNSYIFSISSDVPKEPDIHNLSISAITSTHITKPYESSPSIKPFKVFLEPVFIVVLVVEAVYEGSFIAFVTIIVDFTMDVGLPLTDAKYVLLTFSVFSSIGLLCFGWVTDNGHLSLTNFSGLLLVCRCLSSALIPFSNGLPFLLVAVSLHGLCEAPVANMFPLIIADCYVKEVHEMAISCKLFLSAPVYLVTPYLIGYFRDDLGSYLYLFYLMSFCSLLSSVLLFFSPQIGKLRCGREETILRNKTSQCPIFNSKL